jgi:nucleoside-specific outer membrane channel protein Tsx
MKALLSALAVFAAASPAAAEDFILWHTENIQLLRGADYELGDQERTIITVEHAHRSRWGDLFLFADFTIGDDGQRAAYGEITPRLSLSRTTGQDWSFGPVSDVYIAGNFEIGDEGLDRQLFGVAVDLDAPGFAFLRAHAFRRDDRNRPGSTWQATIAWNRPFQLGDQRFLFEGFTDIQGAEGPFSENQLAVPRLLWNLPGQGGEAGPLWLGIEHQCWKNKFGLDGVRESFTQLQLKWVVN